MSMLLCARLFVLCEYLQGLEAAAPGTAGVSKEVLQAELEDILAELEVEDFAEALRGPSMLDSLLLNLRRWEGPVPVGPIIEYIRQQLAELPVGRLVGRVPGLPPAAQLGPNAVLVSQLNCLAWCLIRLRERLEIQARRDIYAVDGVELRGKLQSLQRLLPNQVTLLNELDQWLAKGPRRPVISAVRQRLTQAIAEVDELLLAALSPRFDSGMGQDRAA